MEEHRVPLRESSNVNVLKAHDQANFIHWIAWDKTAYFREEHRHSLWNLFLRKSSSSKLSMPFPHGRRLGESLSALWCSQSQTAPCSKVSTPPTLLPSECQHLRTYHIPEPQQHAQKQVWDTLGRQGRSCSRTCLHITLSEIFLSALIAMIHEFTTQLCSTIFFQL